METITETHNCIQHRDQQVEGNPVPMGTSTTQLLYLWQLGRNCRRQNTSKSTVKQMKQSVLEIAADRTRTITMT